MMKKLYVKSQIASAALRNIMAKLVMATLVITTMGSCDDDEELPLCETSNTAFQQLYNATLSSNSEFENAVTMDLEVHSYTFRVNANTVICKVGYQGQPNLNTPYAIRIINTANNQVLYSGTHTFSDTQTSYVDIGSVTILANTEYRIERELAFETSLSEVIGRLIKPTNMTDDELSFPINHGALSITGSSFHGMGGPIDDVYLPFIDIVFQN